MGIWLRTNRLMLRDYQPQDDALVREIFLHPQMAAFHLSGQNTEIYAREHLESSLRQTCWQPRMAYDLVMVSAEGNAIGLCGINLSLFSHPFAVATLNWHVKPQYWRRGYATEAAASLLTFGFETLSLSTIGATAFADNAASLRVMEKIGLRPMNNNATTTWWRALTCGESRPIVQYQLTQTAWLANRLCGAASRPMTLSTKAA